MSFHRYEYNSTDSDHTLKHTTDETPGARTHSPRGDLNSSHTAPKTMRPPISCDVAVRHRLSRFTVAELYGLRYYQLRLIDSSYSYTAVRALQDRSHARHLWLVV